MHLIQRVTIKLVSAYFVAAVFALTFTSCGGKDESKATSDSTLESCTLEVGTLDNCALE